jgi:hypothetical protein
MRREPTKEDWPIAVGVSRVMAVSAEALAFPWNRVPLMFLLSSTVSASLRLGKRAAWSSGFPL